jgi:hypothetical protein
MPSIGKTGQPALLPNDAYGRKATSDVGKSRTRLRAIIRFASDFVKAANCRDKAARLRATSALKAAVGRPLSSPNGHRKEINYCGAAAGLRAPRFRRELTRLGGYRLMVASPKVRCSAANLIRNRRN